MLDADVCARALGARDPRFDGVFFVGITTTRIYCRPICPARVSHEGHRRFFASAAAAERAGYRPCLRCRPELAPGRGLVDAVPRLAHAAAFRIAAGALNGQSVAQLAREFGVGERHLRRALQREIGVSPLELAQTHRLLLAKQLLADTRLSVIQVAYASGFQSLRRFNAVFQERYRMAPTAVRRTINGDSAESVAAVRRAPTVKPSSEAPNELVSLTLGYRPPLAWSVFLDLLRREAIPGIELVWGNRYGRTVRISGCTGVLFAEDASPGVTTYTLRGAKGIFRVAVSSSLVPALMPLLARLRQLFDLDADFSEAHDLSADHPDVVRVLDARWNEEARLNHVFPLVGGAIDRCGNRPDTSQAGEAQEGEPPDQAPPCRPPKGPCDGRVVFGRRTTQGRPVLLIDIHAHRDCCVLTAAIW